MISRFAEEPNVESFLVEAQPINIGAASGRLVHSEDLEAEVEKGLNPKDVILVVNGDVPYDMKDLYSNVAGAWFVRSETAAQTSHFSIDLKTLGIPAVFYEGRIDKDGFVFKAEEEVVRLPKRGVVSIDATEGLIYHAPNSVVEPEALRYVRQAENFDKPPEGYGEFRKDLDLILSRIDRPKGLHLNVEVNLYTPEQLQIAMRVHSRAHVNLVRTENHLLDDPDRRTFQTLFSMLYAKQLLETQDSALAKEIKHRDLFSTAIDQCVPSLVTQFRDQQHEHLLELMNEYYQLIKSSRGGVPPSQPHTMQVRFLDVSLNELFTRKGTDFRRFMFDSSYKNQREEFFKKLGQPRFGKRVKQEWFDATFDALAQSEDYFTEARGVRLMRKAPEVYEAQAAAFARAMEDIVEEYQDFSQYVNMVFLVPYVSEPSEVQKVRELMKEGSKKGTGEAPSLGVLLELHQAASYMDSYLSDGAMRFEIGSNDLIANWNGLTRAKGFRFGDPTLDEAVVRNFDSYLRTIHEGIEKYKMREDTSDKKLKEQGLYIALAGELPARILRGVLSSPYADRIDALGLPALKIPHIALELYKEEETILEARRRE